MQVPAKVIALALVLLTVLIALIGYIQRSPIIHIALVAFPFLFLMMSNPGAWFVAIMGLSRSGLVFPGIPQGLEVVHVMMAGFVVLIIARNIIIKPRSGKLALSEYFVYGFLAVIGITIFFRGFGLRALGGESWGGMGYIKLFIAAGFYLTAKYIQLTPRQIKLSIVFLVLFSFIPAISQVIFIASGGRIYQQYMFVHAYVAGLLGSLEAAETGRGIVRYQLMGTVAINLMLAALILFPFRRAYRFLVVALICGAILAGGLSGFRGTIMTVLGVVTLYIILVSEGQRIRRLFQLAIPVVIGFVILLLTVQQLPIPVQRAVTWVPFVETSALAQMDAEGSSQWRIEVWQMAWQEVPNYLWVGKGYALNPADITSMAARRDSVLMAVFTQDYHNGPLSLLLVFGIPGLLMGTGFLVASSYELIKRARNLGQDPFIRRFYFVFTARYIFSAVTFFVIFGDARESFVQAFVMMAFLNMAYRAERPVAAAEPAEITPNQAPPRRNGTAWTPAISFNRSAGSSPFR